MKIRMHAFHTNGKLSFWVVNRSHNLVELDDYGLVYQEIGSEVGATFLDDIRGAERILGKGEPLLLEVDTFNIIKTFKNGVNKEYIIDYCFVNDTALRHYRMKVPRYLRRPIHLY